MANLRNKNIDTAIAVASGVGTYAFLAYISYNKSTTISFLSFCAKNPALSQFFAGYAACYFMALTSNAISLGNNKEDFANALIMGGLLSIFLSVMLIEKGMFQSLSQITKPFNFIFDYLHEVAYAGVIIGATASILEKQNKYDDFQKSIISR